MQINNGENGFKIAPGPRDKVVEELAKAMRTLLASTSTRMAMGTAARSFVYENYHSATGRRIRAIYDEVLANEAPLSNGAGFPVGS